MIVFEILELNFGLLNILFNEGIRVSDIRYIALYNDFVEMLEDGNKVSYIVAELSRRYHVSERKVYGLIKHFRKTVHIKCSRK